MDLLVGISRGCQRVTAVSSLLSRRCGVWAAGRRSRRWQRWQDDVAPLLDITDACRVCDRPLRRGEARGRLRQLGMAVVDPMCGRCRRLAGPGPGRLISNGDQRR